MARKNIFQLVEESYNVQDEIRKINRLFTNEKYFEAGYTYYSLNQLLEDFLFTDWKYRGTCITIEEYFVRANANISNSIKNSEEVIINNLEVMENFAKLYFDNSDELYSKHNIQYYAIFNDVFCDLINTLEKRMGLTTREYKDRVVIYPQNASLEKAIDLCEDEDVQWQLIRYVREDLKMAEKRNILTALGSYIEPILKARSLQNAGYKQLESDVGFMLNCFHVRHNNKDGAKAQDYIVTLSEKELEEWYDKLYNAIISVIIINDHISAQTELATLKTSYNWKT